MTVKKHNATATREGQHT